MSQPHRTARDAARSDNASRRGQWGTIASAVCALALLAGCPPLSGSPPAYPESAVALKLPAGAPGWQRAHVKNQVEKYFGTPEQPTLWSMSDYIGGDSKTGYTAHLQVGRDLFRKHYLHCHGISGRGDGPTAEFLHPLPRNFWRGKFKYKSGDLASKPTREDLIRTITLGVHGTAMPSFRICRGPRLRARLRLAPGLLRQPLPVAVLPVLRIEYPAQIGVVEFYVRHSRAFRADS